jgi:PKD repeat protein
MRKRFLLLFSLVGLLVLGQTFTASAQCNLHIAMHDSYGDGWNGASLKVYNGTVLLGTATLANGLTGSATILAPDMTDIRLTWTAGSYPEECGFTVTNGIGIDVYVCEFTESPAPGSFFVFNNVCSSVGTDVNLIDLPISSKVAAGDLEISGVVRSERDTPITSFDAVYSIDGIDSDVTAFSGLSLGFNQSYAFTHPQTADILVGNHEIKLRIQNINGLGDDDIPANNALTRDVLCVNEIFQQNVVYEEGTGTWCGWCPRGLVGLNTMAHNYTDGTWIGIGVHNGDPMTVAAYDQGIGTFISGYPSGVMNRKSVFDPGLSSLEPAYFAAKAEIPLGKIVITGKTWNVGTRKLTVQATSNFAMDLAGTSYNVAMVVVESDVTGTTSQWNQANYYAGGGNGNLIDWDGTNWATLSNPVPAANMVYNHVGRVLVGGWNGVPGIIPADVVYGSPYTYEFTHTLAAASDPAEVTVVVMLIDANTGVIANAYELALEGDILAPGFSSDVVGGVSPLQVAFTDETAGGNVAGWSWDFDNDGIEDSNVQNPTFTYLTPGAHSVALTVVNQTGNQFKVLKENFVFVGTVGLGQLAENIFTCYPNPATDVIHIKSGSPLSSIRIFNVSGQKVYEDLTAKSKFQSIDVTSFKKGVYFMELNTERETKRIKLVVD